MNITKGMHAFSNDISEIMRHYVVFPSDLQPDALLGPDPGVRCMSCSERH